MVIKKLILIYIFLICVHCRADSIHNLPLTKENVIYVIKEFNLHHADIVLK